MLERGKGSPCKCVLTFYIYLCGSIIHTCYQMFITVHSGLADNKWSWNLCSEFWVFPHAKYMWYCYIAVFLVELQRTVTSLPYHPAFIFHLRDIHNWEQMPVEVINGRVMKMRALIIALIHGHTFFLPLMSVLSSKFYTIDNM